MLQDENTRSFSNVKTLVEKTKYATSELSKEEEYVINKYIKSSDVVLDMGCGLGRVTRGIYNKRIRDVYGLDISIDCIMYAMEHSNIMIEYNICSMDETHYESNFFDVVFITFNSIDYVDDRQKVINECYRILKPNGLLIFCFHDANYYLNRLGWLKALLMNKSNISREFQDFFVRKEEHVFGKLYCVYSSLEYNKKLIEDKFVLVESFNKPKGSIYMICRKMKQ